MAAGRTVDPLRLPARRRQDGDTKGSGSDKQTVDKAGDPSDGDSRGGKPPRRCLSSHSFLRWRRAPRGSLSSPRRYTFYYSSVDVGPLGKRLRSG
ncbi:hypothetical protein EYF80_050722 [Liparis tanakae]|uniref:Uncharacterized protein n=1 Tax=Liparis tanakae TaxID=230148 RepID=A0A4Z2FDQ6_9TELE|nr:hypothetical protein EYF80_050722 [Liparis tanakae]